MAKERKREREEKIYIFIYVYATWKNVIGSVWRVYMVLVQIISVHIKIRYRFLD